MRDTYNNNLDEGLDEEEFLEQIDQQKPQVQDQSKFLSEWEINNRKQAAMKYNLEQIKNYQPYQQNEEEKIKKERAARFGMDYSISNPQANLGLSNNRQEWPKEVERVENAIYLYGLDKLQYDEIWEFFSEYNPTDINMLNKSTGVIFFETSNNCKSAITNNGKPILEQDDLDISSEQRQEIIKYEWHRNDMEIEGGQISLVYRMATVKDLKNKNQHIYNQQATHQRNGHYARSRQNRYTKRGDKKFNGVQKKYSYRRLADYDQPIVQQYFDFDPAHIQQKQEDEELYVDDLREMLPSNKQNTQFKQEDSTQNNQGNGNSNIFSAFNQIYNNPDTFSGPNKYDRKKVKKALNKSKNLSKNSKRQLINQLHKNDKQQGEPQVLLNKLQKEKNQENYKDSVDEGLQQVEFDIDMHEME